MGYLPGKSDSGMFGGNSNWRGPIWMPVNGLIVRALLGTTPTTGTTSPSSARRTGRLMNLYQVAQELSRRLAKYLPARQGRKAAGLRRNPEVQGRPALARPRALLRVLPRRQRRRARRESPDRLDPHHRPHHASVRDDHRRAGGPARQTGRRHRGANTQPVTADPATATGQTSTALAAVPVGSDRHGRAASARPVAPLAQLPPSTRVRQVVTGFLFGAVGASLAMSRVGTESGAHINPAVTLAFWLFRKIEARVALGYILAQLTGATLGCLPLVAWGAISHGCSRRCRMTGPACPAGSD